MAAKGQNSWEFKSGTEQLVGQHATAQKQNNGGVAVRAEEGGGS